MRDDVGRLAPDLWPQHLDVRHHAGNLRLARDGDDLLDRLDDADIVIALVADVAGVDRVRKWRRGPGEADDLRRVRIFGGNVERRSEEHTSELQSLMRISYAVFCLKKKNN